MKLWRFCFSALVSGLLAFQTSPMMAAENEVKPEVYGELPDGREVKIFTLTNRHGLIAKVMEYGAILVSLEVPDACGHSADVTLGYETLEGWLENSSYFGATVGRFGNRIKEGRFTLDGKAYSLATNNGPNHLHGGKMGFDKVLWAGTIVEKNQVEFRYFSKDGEGGYPGNIAAKVTYTLTDADELTWHAEATTDAPTILNMVHHTYWNLSGDASTPITDHHLMIAAEAYLPTDAGMIPTGKIEPVAGTPMDFRQMTAIGERIDAPYEPLQFGGGYDHAWVLNGERATRLAARLQDPKTGRMMEVFTNQPAVQFYAGNFLNGTALGTAGVHYAKRSGMCLETEGFPDSPNQPDFPSSVLRPGEKYSHVLTHRFSNAQRGNDPVSTRHFSP